MKDNHTLGHNPDNVVNWVKLVRDEIKKDIIDPFNNFKIILINIFLQLEKLRGIKCFIRTKKQKLV